LTNWAGLPFRPTWLTLSPLGSVRPGSNRPLAALSPPRVLCLTSTPPTVAVYRPRRAPASPVLSSPARWGFGPSRCDLQPTPARFDLAGHSRSPPTPRARSFTGRLRLPWPTPAPPSAGAAHQELLFQPPPPWGPSAAAAGGLPALELAWPGAEVPWHPRAATAAATSPALLLLL
jgi:hypothetical protein